MTHRREKTYISFLQGIILGLVVGFIASMVVFGNQNNDAYEQLIAQKRKNTKIAKAYKVLIKDLLPYRGSPEIQKILEKQGLKFKEEEKDE